MHTFSGQRYDVAIEHVPWQISIHNYISGNANYLCNGVIIDNLYALTTASCVQNITAKERIFARVGSSNYFDDGNIKTIRNIVIHENFNNPIPFANDIAIIKFNRPILHKHSVNYIRLLFADIHPSQTLALTGFRVPPPVDGFQDAASFSLHAHEITLVDHDECVRAHGTNSNGQFRVHNDTLCVKRVPTQFPPPTPDSCRVSILFIYFQTDCLNAPGFFFYFF